MEYHKTCKIVTSMIWTSRLDRMSRAVTTRMHTATLCKRPTRLRRTLLIICSRKSLSRMKTKKMSGIPHLTTSSSNTAVSVETLQAATMAAPTQIIRSEKANEAMQWSSFTEIYSSSRSQMFRVSTIITNYDENIAHRQEFLNDNFLIAFIIISFLIERLQ